MTWFTSRPPETRSYLRWQRSFTPPCSSRGEMSTLPVETLHHKWPFTFPKNPKSGPRKKEATASVLLSVLLPSHTNWQECLCVRACVLGGVWWVEGGNIKQNVVEECERGREQKKKCSSSTIRRSRVAARGAKWPRNLVCTWKAKFFFVVVSLATAVVAVLPPTLLAKRATDEACSPRAPDNHGLAPGGSDAPLAVGVNRNEK